MKNNLKSILAVVLAAFILFPEVSEGMSKREFARSLREAAGDKGGKAAIRAVVRELKEGVAESPRSATAFTRLANNFLKRTLRPNQRSQAASALVQALGVSYFKGPKQYDPEDPAFQSILGVLVSSLPAAAKTEEGIAPIIRGLTRLNKIRRGSEEDLQILVDLVRAAAGLAAAS